MSIYFAIQHLALGHRLKRTELEAILADGLKLRLLRYGLEKLGEDPYGVYLDGDTYIYDEKVVPPEKMWQACTKSLLYFKCYKCFLKGSSLSKRPCIHVDWTRFTHDRSALLRDPEESLRIADRVDAYLEEIGWSSNVHSA